MLVGVLGDADQMAAERPVLESLAKDLHAFLEYVPGETSELVAALEQGRIHLIASLPGSSPYSKSVGFSRKYCNHAWEERERVWGIRQGENAFLLEIDEALEAVRCP